MKSYKIIKKIFLGFLFVFGIITANAQSDMVKYLAAGKADANKLIGSYIGPFLETFGSNLNNGWYSTADPLKLGRFTITVGATASFVPKDKQSFVIDEKDYTVIKTPSGPVTTPTMFGEKTSPSGVSARFVNGSYMMQVPLHTPGGYGISISPYSTYQVSVGLIKGTEVMIRFFPKIKIDENKVGWFGFGLKHNIKQWMPFMSKLPFELSFIGAYSSASIDVVSNELLPAQVGVYNPTPLDYTKQVINFSSSAWNTNLVISRKFTLFTVFGGIRLSHYKTTLDIKGNYPITVINSSGVTEIANLVDPIQLEGSGTQFAFNGGFRVKFGFLALFAEGSLAPGGYSSATAGLNFGFFN